MTQFGFWRNMNSDNRRLYMRDSPVISNVYYLFPQGGGPAGAHTFTTFADLAPHLKSRDTILFSGVLREQARAPVGVFDVSIIGAANQPRQATSGGVPTGGGASWLAPTVLTAGMALLELVEQGWTIENIQFAPPAALDCIRFRRMETAAIPDSSHGVVRGCYFSAGGAGGHGINLGECKRILVEDCEFESLTGTCIRRTADGGIANTQFCRILRNHFGGNANDIVLANGTNILVRDNLFMDAVDGARKFIQVTGANLVALNNYTPLVATAGYSVANGFEGGATDMWRHYVSDAADPLVAVPA